MLLKIQVARSSSTYKFDWLRVRRSFLSKQSLYPPLATSFSNSWKYTRPLSPRTLRAIFWIGARMFARARYLGASLVSGSGWMGGGQAESSDTALELLRGQAHDECEKLQVQLQAKDLVLENIRALLLNSQEVYPVFKIGSVWRQ